MTFGSNEFSEITTEFGPFMTGCRGLTIDVGRKLLPSYQCRYHIAAYQDSLFDAFAIAFPLQLERAVPKRRSEYLAGRFCAQRVLQALGFNALDCEVPIGGNREPIWPAMVVGSIAHSAESAVCIATTDPEIIGVGIDIEQEMAPRTASSIAWQVVDAGEDRIIRSHFGAYSQGLTAVFSAKETIYKAAFRIVGRFFDFSAVKLLRLEASRMSFAVAEKLSDRLQVGFTIPVNYNINAAEIQTATCLFCK